MKHIGVTTWDDVFNNWKEREAHDPDWIRLATEKNGWPNWESWRNFSADLLRAKERTWELFKFTEPKQEIPTMLIGPFRAWQSRVPHKNKTTFEELIRVPEQNEFFRAHKKVSSMIERFPAPTELIGLLREDTGQIVCIDGHHRATAFTIALDEERLFILDGTICIAVARLSSEETGILDEVLERGSSKIS